MWNSLGYMFCFRGKGKLEIPDPSSYTRMDPVYLRADQFVRLQTSARLAIIDVRDDERSYDGHIAGSMHYASATFEEQIPHLLQKIKGEDGVVFHCAKSQVRGPSCARMLVNHFSSIPTTAESQSFPKVYILERGFDGWAGAGRPVCTCLAAHCKASRS